MKKFLTAFCLLTSFYVQSQIPYFKWANTFLTGKVTHDASGNLYVTGNFSGSGDFDPGPGTYSLTSAGLEDIFILKIDPNGNLLWAKQIGGAGDDQGMDIATDASGNIVLASYFSSTVNYNPGGPVQNLVSSGSSDIGFAKYDGNGNFIWAKRIGGPNTDIVRGISLDASGNLCATGYFMDPLDFDPSAATYTLTTTSSVNDAFVMKLDAGGNFLWAKDLGGTANTMPYAITIDASGNVYTTGEFTGTSDFDPSGTVYNLASFAASVKDCYISKLDASGNFVWAKQVGGTGQDLGYAVKTDGAGNVYTVGNYAGTGDFDPSAASFTMSTTAANNGFVLKLSSAGALVWAKQTQGTTAGLFLDIQIDPTSNLFLSGRFSGTVDFDPAAGTANLTSYGAQDAFISKWDAAGTYQWAQQFGGTGVDLDESMTLDAQGNLILSGTYSGIADFDPSGASYILPSTSTEFLVKLSTCPVASLTLTGQNNVLCNSLSSGSATVSASGGSGFTYSWTPGGFTTASVSGLAAFIYTAVATNSCANTASVLVTITQPPAFTNTNSGSQTICSTQSLSLFVNASGGVMPYTYNWTPSTGLSATTMATVTASPAATTTYTFTAIDANGCGTGGSLNVTVNSLKDISGTVTESANAVAGQVTLYEYEPFLTKFDSVTTQNISGGAYTFTSVPLGSYIVKATPTASTLQVTYGSSSVSWKNATTITHSCIAVSSQSIQVQPFTALGAGSGLLSGKILEGQGFGQRPGSASGPLAPGNPIGGIIVKGGKNPGGNMFAQTVTGANGTYTLSGLPNNAAGESYFILVDIPGLDTNNTYHKVISLSSPQYTNLDFVVDSARVNPLPEATGMKDHLKTGGQTSIYPNPAKHSVTIFYAVAEDGPVTIELFDVIGKKARTFLQGKHQQPDTYRLTVGLGELNAGIYFLKVTSGGHETVTKLVVSD